MRIYASISAAMPARRSSANARSTASSNSRAKCLAKSRPGRHDGERILPMRAGSAPLVSVLMGVHNGSACLQKALDSIFNQTFDNFELIVVDDASTDDTA